MNDYCNACEFNINGSCNHPIADFLDGFCDNGRLYISSNNVSFTRIANVKLAQLIGDGGEVVSECDHVKVLKWPNKLAVIDLFGKVNWYDN